jgi:hypothetical protein
MISDPAAGLPPIVEPLRHDGNVGSQPGTGVTSVELFVLGVAVLVTYVVSLTLNPWVKCSKCHGKPKKQGSLFSYAHHICDKCGGSGQQVRFGRRYFNIGRGNP